MGVRTSVRALRPTELAWLFGVPTVLNTFACKVAIPAVDALEVFPIEVTYFVCVGFLVLAPMFAWSLHLSAQEIGSYRAQDILGRMRVRRIEGQDWLWTVAAFVALCVASFIIAKILMPRFGLDATPFFLGNMPLAPEHRWILGVWPVFFFFNIFGEEFLWRGISNRDRNCSRGSGLGSSMAFFGPSGTYRWVWT